MSERTPHVVIVGAGFAGLAAARRLADAPVKVTVVDRTNHHLFQPLLYQVATAALNSAEIASPIRALLPSPNTTVLLAEVTGVDPELKVVKLADGELPYDFLIVATGATHSYFGHDEWAPIAPGLKTLDDALEVRRRVLLSFESAEREPDPVTRRAQLTFAIVGAGPTGVEMAGALAEVARHALAHDFRNFDPASARVLLLEGAERVLPGYPADLSAAAARALRKLGVEVRTGAKVTAVDEAGLVASGERIDARTVIWAAGVRASALGRDLPGERDRAGRIVVTPFLTVPQHPELFVVGDLSHAVSNGEVVPALAPAAMQMGKLAARNVLFQLRGEPMVAFDYWDRGSFSVIGRGQAVGIAFSAIKLKGGVAWLAWLFIHLLFLVGFRNRLAVLLDWAYSYVAVRRAARLITGVQPASALPPPHEGQGRGAARSSAP